MKRSILRSGRQVALAILFAACGVSEASAAPGWQPFNMEVSWAPGNYVPLLDRVWADVLKRDDAAWTNPASDARFREHAPATFFYAVLPLSVGGGVEDTNYVLVSSLLGVASGCDNGANELGAKAEPARCPVRIAVVDGGSMRVEEAGFGCFVVGATDTEKDRGSDNAFAALDAATRTIYLTALSNGREIEGCAHRIEFRQ